MGTSLGTSALPARREPDSAKVRNEVKVAGWPLGLPRSVERPRVVLLPGSCVFWIASEAARSLNG